jgi:putative heme-binding domain-containing protein
MLRYPEASSSFNRSARSFASTLRMTGIARVTFVVALVGISAGLLGSATTQPKAEAWSDAALPVKEHLSLWLDVARQPAAWTANQKAEIVSGDLVDVLYDASGNLHHFLQPLKDAQPRFLGATASAAVRFDGTNDHLTCSTAAPPLKEFTIFIVAAPRSNEGTFRAFLSAHDTGKNDYQTGFNVDMGSLNTGGDGFNFLNFEGRGFVGQVNLLNQLVHFGKLSTYSITSAPGKSGTQVFLNGKMTGQRDRADEAVSIANLILSARCYSNEAAPPYVSGFLDGDVAEVLLYDRVLSQEKRRSVEEYLSKKHEKTQAVLSAANEVGQPVKRLESPPQVQMFVPGFSARQLPLDLTNINNVRYRDDGKLIALAYDGTIYILSDTNGDGLEDKAEVFWDSKGGLVSPIGMALTPPHYSHGRGMFVAAKGKLSLIVDTNNDDKADKEIVVATGWPGTFHQVDAVGVAVAPDNSIYFGIGCWNFADPYQLDKAGKSHYDLKSERGTIMKVSPDFSKREIIATGVRFSVGMAFNHLGDLFASDQEGATWSPNGNPFDELLHIQTGRHYGFPPRHPTHNPGVIDEPSVFDYAPQHQSTCGLVFNEPVNGGPVFGPASWIHDAIVCGESRGKIYRTKLAKTSAGYVARNDIIGSLPLMTIDACVSPHGDLIIATHSGNPDWGSGPTGKGKLFKVSYKDREAPQPVACWSAGPGEVRIAFDRPLDLASLDHLTNRVSIDYGPYVGAGDRFETMQPGYAAVRRQTGAARHNLPISSVQVTPDRRTLVINMPPQRQAVRHAITVAGSGTATTAPGEISQIDAIDLAYDLTGVSATWQPTTGAAWSGWLPHSDLAVARAFTTGSAEHDALWKSMESPGKLSLHTSLDLWSMLHPAIQPGSTLDFSYPPEKVTIAFESNSPIELEAKGLTPTTAKEGNVFRSTLIATPKEGELLPIALTLTSGEGNPCLGISFHTTEDPRPRALPLRRFLMPWAQLNQGAKDSLASNQDVPDLKGGDWLRGRKIFFGTEAACSKCHQIRGEGSDLGPDLSNLIHRDYGSVLRDIQNPSGALNPEYLGSIVKLKGGRTLGGIVRSTDATHFLVRGDADGERAPIPRSDVVKISPSPISVMPKGIPEGLGPEKMRDLLTFLLTQTLEAAPLEREGAPPPRTRAEVDAIIKPGPISSRPTSAKPLNILLVSGPKDHGAGEHDYPLFQRRWSKLLSIADNVNVTPAEAWPTAAQWERANVVVFYSSNPAWTADKGKELDAFLERGGGLVYLHFAVDGHDAIEPLAERIGLAWRGGSSTFRHGPQDLSVRDSSHPITRRFKSVRFIDESYWQLIGDPKRVDVLLEGTEAGAARPLMWTREQAKGRVFVSIIGHYTWTFDDPLFRILILRGICWSAHEPADRLTDLATIGARIQN